MDECIDLRLFGSTFAIKTKKSKTNNKEDEEAEIKGGNNISITGPVQFKFGKSLHRVKLEHVKGTTVMPSDEQKGAGTFTEKYVLPYSLIAFGGLVNGKVAEVENIKLTENDLDLMYEAMWEGTKALFTTSKAQMPQLLMEVVYKDEYFHIGSIEQGLKLISEKMDEEIRSTNDYKVDATNLVTILDKYHDKIQSIRIKQGDNIKFLVDGQEKNLATALKEKGLVINDFSF
jgi:CRISPR-associated protein Csh2